MINLIYFVVFFCIFFVGFRYILNRKYVLIILIRLEFIGLILFFIIYLNLSNFGLETYFLMVFLTFCVCEGVIGLSLLVNMIRSHGNDLIKSLNFLKC